MSFIKRLLGIHKKYPKYSKDVQDQTLEWLLGVMISYSNKMFHKNPITGIYEAIGPAHKKHVRNHILTKLDPNNEKAYTLTNGGGTLSPGYVGYTPILDGITEELIPYVSYVAISAPKSIDFFDNYGEAVEYIYSNGLNKNPFKSETQKITTLPNNEELIHLLSFKTVYEHLKFKPSSSKSEPYLLKRLQGLASLPKLPKTFNKHVLLSLYLQAKVTNNPEDLKRFNKMFHLDKDNNLFPAVLAFDLGQITKNELKNFIAHHYFNNHTMDIFNLLAPLHILERITPLKGL
jgi:hypothetical protein